MTSMNVAIGSNDAGNANALLSAARGQTTGISLPVLELGVGDSYHLTYASYAMAGSAPWASQKTVPPVLPYGSPPAGVPSLRIWQLSEDLVNLPQQATAAGQPPLPSFDVRVSSVNESTGATQTAPASYYGWATQIGVTVKKLAALAPTPVAATTYELVGANEYDVVLLERVLTAMGLKVPGFSVQQLLLLHASTAGASGLTDDGDGVMTFITQANLSTVTRPPTSLTRALVAPVPQNAQKPEDFVRLLWECSITRSGGFYLYYSTDPAAHTGLPDAIFNDKGEAVLTLLLLYAAPTDRARQNRVAGYMNAVVTGGFVDGSTSAVYAQARSFPAYVEAGSGDALAGLATTYRTSVAELAEANAGVALGAEVVVNGGGYQVRPSDPGPSPSAIASWFGTTVAALIASNPGVDFTKDLVLWSNIVLPDGLAVPPNTAGRGTLRDVAGYYGVTLDALAADNAAQQGIFTGETIEVTELVTPGAGDKLSDLAADNYMDPVQLVEDNADVPLTAGAKVVATGGLYEVPATANAGTLAAIATRFGVQAADVQSANPGLDWTNPQPPWTLVLLPSPLTLTAGTSPSAATMGQIASYYGVRLAQLALDNADTPGLFNVPLRVRGGPLARQAASPPGTVTYGMSRTAAPPPADTDPIAALQRLYNLLSYRVPDGLKGFTQTNPGPPLGPITAPPGGGGDKMRQPQSDGIWRYQKAVPYSRLASPTDSDGAGPDPANSPYLGVGGLLQLDFAWNDLFGNRGLTPLTQPALDPSAPLNRPPARALFTDPIVGLSEWPSVGFDYQVVAGDAGQASLEITVAFDGCTYLVKGEQGCPVSKNPPKVDPVARAQHDLTVYERICYQLAAGLAVTVETTFLPGLPQTIDAEPLGAFAVAIYEWLSARAGGTTTDPFPAMAPIAVPLDLAAVAQTQPDQIFELGVALTMSRPPSLVDPDLRVEGKAAVNPTTIPPHHEQETTGGPYTLAAFAESFETAMQLAGQWRLKLAVGVDRERAERAGSGAPLWAVRLGLGAGQPLAVSVVDPNTPTTYAPRPISNAPRTDAADVKGYVTGSGLTGPVTTLTFAGVDLDGWTASLLAAVDKLLAPGYSTAIGLVDSYLAPGSTTHLSALATAKEDLAKALAELVIPVLPGAEGADPAAARETFRQQLLVQLRSFYTTDAIVQFEVDATSQSVDPTSSPRLFGDLEQKGDDPLPVTLSDPKVSLVEPTSGPPPTLTFLLSTAAGQTDVAENEAKISLQLTYHGTNVEHQIGTLPGIAGYQPSSWLSFVRSEDPWPLELDLGQDGAFEVPLVLRGFPTPPTMREQSGAQAVQDGTQGLKLDQTLGWDYQLVYSEPIHYQQDTIHLTIEFNHAGSTASEQTGRTPTGSDDPFAALAQFVTSYPQVQQDIDTYVAPIDPSKIDPKSQDFIDADVALTTFTDMVEAVAATLGGGPATAGASLVALPVESYELTIAEGSVQLPSLQHSGQEIEALIVTLNVPDALAATVAVDIEGCSRQTPPDGAATADAVTDGTSTYSYVYVDSTTKDWLLASTGETIAARTVRVPGMNVLGRQDAWASARIVRNENAVEAFRYQTPTVFFASPNYPTNAFTKPSIEVASIPSGSPQTRKPEEHLQALFAALFAQAPAGEQTIQLECRYSYALSGAALDAIDLPVYLLAPTEADPKTDLVIPDGGLPADPSGGPLVGRLGAALRTWWNTNLPSLQDGAFDLSVTVMSQLTGQPLIVLANLHLTEHYVDWS